MLSAASANSCPLSGVIVWTSARRGLSSIVMASVTTRAVLRLTFPIRAKAGLRLTKLTMACRWFLPLRIY